jgi:hypothetical protein
VRAIATALGGHCKALRRTAVGPFEVEEADPDRLIPASVALARLPADAVGSVAEDARAAVVALEEPAELMFGAVPAGER